ncbi:MULTISPECIES: hypothetical protein [unclassified Lactococcus]|uniref:hypothetical protein n=1 Tax=unclassified Lactococcus TaxID=2643510 RepID=UPI00129528F5|nr:MULTISPECIES: hypothetical protein [unclassified Lactococcus]MQW22848.1 hypothetical protein [Lactococcus sp. dk101]
MKKSTVVLAGLVFTAAAIPFNFHAHLKIKSIKAGIKIQKGGILPLEGGIKIIKEKRHH